MLPAEPTPAVYDAAGATRVVAAAPEVPGPEAPGPCKIYLSIYLSTHPAPAAEGRTA